MFCGDSAVELLKIKDNSVDMLCSDPPYGYSFMNKGWDQVLPDTEIWRQSYRVLKPGAFITVMAAPRTDVLWRISRDLEEAGFDLSFTNLEFVYHSGFPKASDTPKMLEKRGAIQDVVEKYNGAKMGFQPKPAREIIIVGMKPFSDGSYVDKVLNFEALPDNVKMTYPLIQTPKPAKKEKDFGLSGEEKEQEWNEKTWKDLPNPNVPNQNRLPRKNNHPTVKPIKLMSYLITLFTRPGDWILDPFGGSGTTGLACKLLDRNHIYIDFTQEYYDIAQERLQVSKEDLKKLLKEKISNGQQELF
jgi:site-specific DNA-methyltransferase (adenine-specific)